MARRQRQMCIRDRVKVSETIDDIAEDQTLSLDALDGIRDWLEEWSEEERHTRSVSGLLIDE